MNKFEARDILKMELRCISMECHTPLEDSFLGLEISGSACINLIAANGKAVIDGSLTIRQLEAIIYWMKAPFKLEG